MNPAPKIHHGVNRDGETRKTIFLVSLVILSLLIPDHIIAQGNLLITPRRVVFEGAKRTEELNLANTGKDTATYVVSLKHYRMKEDGSFEEIDQPDPGQFFADQYVRFFPRTVTLPPSEAQVVKMQLANTTNLAKGEYRSHVYFRAVPKQAALGETEKVQDTTTLSVRLIPVFGITIPVIVRIGDFDAGATISDVSFEILNDTLPRINMTFNRTGTMSIYGDIEVNHVSKQGKITQVGLIRGIAVYSPIPRRLIKIDLNRLPDVNYREGQLQVVYSGQKDAKPYKIAEAALVLK